MVVAVALARALLFRRLPKRVFVVLWCLVIARLLVPVSLASPVSAWNLVDDAATQAVTAAQDVRRADDAPVAQDAAAVEAAPTGAEGGDAGEGDAGARGIPPSERGATGDTGATDGDGGVLGHVAQAAGGAYLSARDFLGGALPVLHAAQAAGTAIAACLFAALYGRALRGLRSADPTASVRAQAWLARHRLPLRRLRVRESAAVSSPFTYGVLRPVVVVPRGFDWADEDALLVLEHEYVHVRHFDMLLKLLAAAALCVYWFDPLVWALYALLGRDIELSCDEAVARTLPGARRRAYATLLVDASERRSELLPALGGVGAGLLEQRVSVSLRPGSLTAPAAAASLVLACALVLAFGTSGVVAPLAPTAEGLAGPSVVEGSVREAPLGSLPNAGQQAQRVDVEGITVLATPAYALSLPDSALGTSFSWSYDGTERAVTRPDGATATVSATLSVRTGGDGALLPSSFTVAFLQAGDEADYWQATDVFSQAASTGGGATVSGGTEGTAVVVTADEPAEGGTGFDGRVWRVADCVSAGRYAYARPAEGGTDVVTPAYTVFVPDGALPKGWSFTYSDATHDVAGGARTGRELRIYASDADRAASFYAARLVWDQGGYFADGARGYYASEAGGSQATQGEQGRPFVVESLSTLELNGAQSPQEQEAMRAQADAWASRVSMAAQG